MRLRVSALTVAASSLLSSCFFGGGPAAQNILAPVAKRTLAEGTSRTSSFVEMRSGARDPTQGMKLEGVFDYAERRGRFTMDASGLGLGQALGSAEIVVAGPVMYVKMGQEVLPGKSWVKVDLSKQGGPLGAANPVGQQLLQNDPTGAIAYLRGAVGKAKREGAEKIRGVQTTRYSFEIDPARTLRSLPDDLKQRMNELAKGASSKTFPAEAWIDGDGLLRKLVYEVEMSKGDGRLISPGKVVVIQELYDFGLDVQVDEPAADSVVEPEALRPQA